MSRSSWITFWWKSTCCLKESTRPFRMKRLTDSISCIVFTAVSLHPPHLNVFDSEVRWLDQEHFSLPHPLPSISRVIWLKNAEISNPATDHARSPPPYPDAPSQYPVVVVGGTFDHLHAGHKILLSMAAWIASKKIIVGVTGVFFLSFSLCSPNSQCKCDH